MSDPPSRRQTVPGVERVRGERPETPDWRADAGARSRHTRLSDHLVEPVEEHDAERATEICAEICRVALPDLAPALLLLPAAERARARVLGAFVLTLFDFAAQPGLDGDRLAELNRWEFRLEEALEGRPPGQPVFVLMAAEETRKPWPRPALDQILAAARTRALASARGKAARRGEPSVGLAEGLATALVGEEATEDAKRLALGLLGAETEARRLAGVPPPWRAAARYLSLAARRLQGGARANEPRLGLVTRVVLLARARLGI